MAYQRALNEKVAQLLVPPETHPGEPLESHHQRRAQEKEMKEYMAALLDAMSAHHCDNAFFDIKFRHNPFGITLTFVDSMSTDIRVQVDNLMETLFRLQRTTLSNSQNFLSTNFHGGAMHLFTFLLLLLTGAEICFSCFLDGDIEELDYDWDSAPGFDLDNTYKLPILR
jgi:hypothetical protein